MKNEIKKIYFKKILSTSLVCLFIFQILYVFAFEPTVLDAAVSDSDSVVVSLTVDPGIAITVPPTVTMLPNLGMSANGAIGEAVLNVKTNNAAGYDLYVKSLTSQALKSPTAQFTDYTEDASGTPDTWSVDNGTYQFGYSAHGNNVSTTTWGTDTTCGSAGTPSTNLKYIGFETSDRVIASSSAVTTTSGTNTSLCFAAEQKGVYAPSGTYTATISATATTK